MATDPEITIRNAHGEVAGRISWAPDGSPVVEVTDQESRWLVELAAERAGAPARPRRRPSCSPVPDTGRGQTPGGV